MTTPLVVFGSAEIAALARFYFDNDSDYRVVAFTVDDEYVEDATFEGLPVVPFSEVASSFPADANDMHVALSYQRLNQLREAKYRQCLEAGYRLASYVSAKSFFWPNDLQVGDNCLILENQTIQPTVRIGNNVMIWSGNHLGHGTLVHDHVYISSHVCISGHCVIGERTFMGVNATTRDFITIGADSFVAMDASVTRDVPASSVVLGARSETHEVGSEMAQRVRSSYFGI